MGSNLVKRHEDWMCCTHGIVILKNDESLEEIKHKSATISLLVHRSDLEIVKHSLKQGAPAFLDPPESDDAFEFYYVLSGKLRFKRDGSTVELSSGDVFYLDTSSKPVALQVIEDSQLLCFCKPPFFQEISKSARYLKKILASIEEKDHYTYSHSKRVRDLSLSIAREMGLSDSRIENLALAALFHDVGKIDVPSSILLKPGQLTKEEFELIKAHPLKGKEMLEHTLFSSCSEIVFQHHERLDGSGYPRALKSDEISLEARIIAAADAFDAMTTDRPYKQAKSVDEAIAELKMMSDKYDSKVVLILEKLLEKRVPSSV